MWLISSRAHQIAQVLAGSHATFIDLLPHLSGKKAASLWVHPSDHHPNELVHAIIGKVLAERLNKDVIAEQPALWNEDIGV